MCTSGSCLPWDDAWSKNACPAVPSTQLECEARCESDLLCVGFLYRKETKRCCPITGDAAITEYDVLEDWPDGWPELFARQKAPDAGKGSCFAFDCAKRTALTCSRDSNCQHRAGKCESLPVLCPTRVARQCGVGGHCRWDRVAKACAPLVVPGGKMDGALSLLQLVVLLPHDAMQALDAPSQLGHKSGRELFRAAMAWALTANGAKVSSADTTIISIDKFYPTVDAERLKKEGGHIWEQTMVALEVSSQDVAQGRVLLHAVKEKSFPTRLIAAFRHAGFVANPTGHRIHTSWISVGESKLLESSSGFVPGLHGEAVVQRVGAPSSNAAAWAVIGASLLGFAAVLCVRKTHCVEVCCGTSNSMRSQASRQYKFSALVDDGDGMEMTGMMDDDAMGNNDERREGGQGQREAAGEGNAY